MLGQRNRGDQEKHLGCGAFLESHRLIWQKMSDMLSNDKGFV